MSFSSSLLRPVARMTLCRASPRMAIPSLSLFASARSFGAAKRSISTRYSSDHEWATFDPASGLATIGVTDYAQKALGDVVFVELPSVGEMVVAGEECGSIESVKAASEIYAPLSGEVKAINEVLDDQPGLVNKSAVEKGWLFKVALTNPAEFEELLTEDGYKALLNE
ncbi:glycine cleavage H-protein-domain-containing protein [Mrakia frigida]|uniref:glycine decarboxylase subunit H n=1 Tax=Mrakia frigida TaxID=29902 RepID=UPI003FCBF92B